jgi:EmrB/QacA subfamily drug resistance transporter
MPELEVVQPAAEPPRAATDSAAISATDSAANSAADSATRPAAPAVPSPVQPAPPPVVRPGLPLGIVVAISCVATFMVILDTAIVNVALPAMRAGLGLSTSAQQWVVDGYLLTFGGLLLLGARAGDLLGRRAVFQLALVVFTLASLLGGLAVNGPMLLAARAAQGIGAAGLAPASLSLITASHHDAARRNRALAAWSATSAAAAAVGVVLGGVLTEALGWRWVLFVNVPIGVALCVAGAITLVGAQAAHRRTRLDLPGAVTVTLGFGALIYGISQADTSGWGSAGVLAALVAGAVLLAVFAVIETRTGQPLIRLDIFRLANLRTANLTMLALGAAMTGSLFFVSLYLQQLVGYSALRAGLAMLPMTVMLAAGALSARSLMAAGIRRLPVYGAILAAVGLAWLTRIPLHPDFATQVLGPTLVLGAGFSVIVLPVAIAATAGVSHRDAGLASGLLNMARQIGGAVGLAVLVTVAGSAAAHQHAASGSAAAAATLHGYHVGLLVAAGICVLAGVAASRLHKPAVTPAASSS